jgi:hypothetical protein
VIAMLVRTPTPEPDPSAVDELLDVLHDLGACGCCTCPRRPHLQTGRVTGGQVWLAIMLPAGDWHECWGPSLNAAAQLLAQALRTRVAC